MIAHQRTQGGGPKASTTSEKEQSLRRMMREMKRVLVAYSGGVDSAYLSLIATQELGQQAVCVMGLSPSVSEFQRREADATARSFGFNFKTINTSELVDPNYAANPTNRCYFCKSELYGKLAGIARTEGLIHIIDGTNADDRQDRRPGRAAASENGLRSPLAELGFSKNEIRERSRHHGLTTWDKPASPCLSSRIAYGVPVTIERLGRIERGEAFLRLQGLKEFRVRVHGDLARIEVSPAELGKVLDIDLIGKLAAEFRCLGFRYATLDLEGFKSGRLNDAAPGTEEYKSNTEGRLEN